MATRLYPTETSAAISPSFDAGWEVTTGANRRAMMLGTANYASSSTSFPNAAGSGVTNDDVLHAQLIYGPIAAQTITGTLKGQNLGREANASTDARAQIIVKVFSSDGSTSRGTLLAMDTAVIGSDEFTVDTAIRTNRKVPRGGATSLSSVTAQAGDYIVIEYGHRNHNTNTSAVTFRGVGTATATTDLPEDQTTTVANDSGVSRNWFEFSQTITPLTAPTPGATSVTVTARTPGNTNAVNAGNAAVTVTANQPTISFLAPARSVLISGTDYTNRLMLDSFSLTECANRGEVGTGGFDVYDSANALTIPALKSIVFDEPGAGSTNKRLYTGFTHTRTTQAVKDSALTARMWAVETTDLNILASDYILTTADSANRSAETDYVRITWLLTTVFGTTGLITAGVVPNSNTVTMDARDYRGVSPADVLAECSEAASKLWFIYDYGAGRLLYYDVATGTSLSSTAKLSDTAGDPDGSTVFKVIDVSVKLSPDRVYSKVHYTYQGGTVTVSNATTATNYRTREIGVLDSVVSDSTLATNKANAILAGATAELTEVDGLTTVLPAAHVNDIRAGQRVQIKLSRNGISAYTYFRVIGRTIQPLTGGTSTSGDAIWYTVSYALASNVLASANGGRGRDDVPQNLSNASDDGASVIVDRGGITVTNGGITVTNGSSVVIIDGTSDMFRIRYTATVNGSVTKATTPDTQAVTLAGLGTLSAPLLVLWMTGNSTVSAAQAAAVNTLKSMFSANYVTDGFVANSSGGSPTSPIVGVFGQTFVSTSLTATPTGSEQVRFDTEYMSAGTFYYYVRYYLIDEAAI